MRAHHHLSKRIDRYRVKGSPKPALDEDPVGGYYLIPFTAKNRLAVVASGGAGWEHVSVRPEKLKRVPTWEEMCFIKNLFWKEDEVVMQLHVAKEQHVNNHPYVLHLWKPLDKEIPLPPPAMVGSMTLQNRFTKVNNQ